MRNAFGIGIILLVVTLTIGIILAQGTVKTAEHVHTANNWEVLYNGK